MLVTYEDIRNDESIKCFITEADKALSALGYTEHSFPHVVKAATMAEMILLTLNYPKRTAELAKIAGYMHDIGNIVNRIDHAQSGAVMAFRLLDRMGMDPAEIAMVISAIGNHDESTAAAVNPIAAALILADKTDVRRSRVRNQDFASFDIHDRVNYAVEESKIYFNEDHSAIILDLKIDTSISAVMDYFEIFLGRMMLSRKAAEFLNISFELVINGQRLLLINLVIFFKTFCVRRSGISNCGRVEYYYKMFIFAKEQCFSLWLSYRIKSLRLSSRLFLFPFTR